MRDDEDIEVLAGAWQTISEDTGFSVPAALRRRRRQQIVYVVELLACAVALACAIFFWLADGGLVYRVAALLYLAIAVVCGIASVNARKRLTAWTDWTPQGLLAFRLRECEVASFSAKSGFVACAILIGFAAFVWLASAFGWDVLPAGFPLFYATVVGVVVLVAGSLSAWRLRTKRRERLRLRALLEELSGS